MKRLLLAFVLGALVSNFAPFAKSQDVSVDFFYNNLNEGSWIEVGNYGYCWQPDVAVNNSSWRPYADGFWAYTDLGWTWVSYEEFGWATYHYGRWIRLADYGWVWVPGYHWAPAWVSWRYGGNYIGWAPLPPETEVVYESRPLTGHLDVEFDIGPASYNFVDVRYIGEPILRSRIVPYEQNVTYVTQTVNVTNITYKNKTVYNYGPDLKVVNQYSSRPVQTLKLERQPNANVAAAAQSGGLTKVQGNSLVVAAPPEIKKGSAAAPPKLKAKVEQPKLEKGWAGVGDENAKQQFKEKLKAEDPTKVPPPTLGATAKPAAASASASASASGLPLEKGKGKKKNKQAEQTQPGASVNPGVAGTTAPETSPALGGKGKGKGKGKNKQPEQLQSSASVIPGASAAAAPENTSTIPETGKGKGKHKNKEAEQLQSAPKTSSMSSPGAGSSASAPPESGQRGKGKGKRIEQQNAGPSSTAPANPPENFNRQPGKHKQFEQPPSTTMSPNTNAGAGGQGGPYGEGRGKYKPDNGNPPAPGGANSPDRGAQQGHGGKGKGQGAATATPGPQ